MLNCKQGDLAVIVKGIDSGKIVTCIRLATTEEQDNVLYCKEAIWLIDRELDWTFWKDGFRSEVLYNKFLTYCTDSLLKPLRDSDKDDETFTWAGKPTENYSIFPLNTELES